MGKQYLSFSSSAVFHLVKACRRAATRFARRGVAAAFLLALLALAAMPMAAISHHDPDCEQGSDCHLPNFVPTRLTFSIPENIGAGQNVNDMMLIPLAEDRDKDDEFLIYTLRDGDAPVENKDEDEPWYEDEDAAAFMIVQEPSSDMQGLWIRTRNGVTYDFETQREYRLKVVACDYGFNRDYIDVVIRVTDETEPPGVPTSLDVTGISSSELLARWTASENMGPAVTYELRYRQCEEGQTCPPERVVWKNGPRRVTDTTAIIPNLAAGEEYEVQVIARNGEGNSDWSDSAYGTTLGNGLTDPVFREGDSTERSFDEDVGTAPNNGLPVGSPVVAFGVGTLTYSLTGPDSDLFDIVNGTGQLRRMAGTNYSYETEVEHIVKVHVSDDKGTPDDTSDDGSAEITVVIKVNDVDEPPLKPDKPTVSTDPVFPLENLDVDWTAPAKDNRPDIIGYDLQYRRRDRSNWTWLSHSRSSTRTTIRNLDMGQSYYVRVRAVNDEGEGPWSEAGSGSTNEENNTAPRFENLPSPRFAENIGNAETATPVEWDDDPMTTDDAVTATDAEGDSLTFSLEGQYATLFSIDPTSGHISTRRGINYDHEPTPSYDVTVKVEDDKGASTTSTLYISIADVDEPPLAPAAPTVTTGTPATTSLNVIWNAPNNTGRPDITGFDVQYRCPEEDSTELCSEWTNVSQDNVDANSRSAVISGLREDTDDTIYEVHVRAKNHEGDGAWSPSGRGKTAASGMDSNTAPKFIDPPTTLSFVENTRGRETIGEPFEVMDDGSRLTITLEGRDADSFEIVPSGLADLNESTLELKIRTRSITYDYETSDHPYDVIVKAEDDEGASAAIAVTIELIDVDETGTPPRGNNGGGGGGGGGPPPNNAPVFPEAVTSPSTPVSRSFPENTPPGENIGLPVTATAADGGPLSYTLEGTDASSFDIDVQGGQIRTKSGVTYDHETKSSYFVIVKAEDDGGASGTIAVTILVTDVAEKPTTPEAPMVTAPDGSRTSLLVTWTAPDTNGGPPLTDYDVQYRQGASGGWNDWVHDGTPTATTITELTPHTGYEVRVRAFNDEAWSDWSPPGSGRTNNAVPAFADADTTRGLPENTPPGVNIGAPVTAADPDGDPLAYTLEGADAASFDIDSGTGQLRTRAGVSYDHEVKSSYAVTARATDPFGGIGALEVAIDVIDVAEKPATPAAPTVRAVAGSSTSLLVIWIAPDTNGGPPLIDYDVQYRHVARGDWENWVHEGTATITEITGLSPHADYLVRVRAFNGELPSDWSPPGDAQTNNAAPAFGRCSRTPAASPRIRRRGKASARL